MGKSLRGLPGRGIGLGRTAVGGAVGGALGGFAGGAFAGGVGGMAGRLFGELMDASPQFAQAMLNLGENIRQNLQPEMEKLAKTVVRAGPAIVGFVEKAVGAGNRLAQIGMGEVKPGDPGYGTLTGVVAGLKAVQDIRGGDVTGFNGNAEEQGAFFRSLFYQFMGTFSPIGFLSKMAVGEQSTATFHAPTYEGDFEGIAPGSI